MDKETMDMSEFENTITKDSHGDGMYQLVRDLYPICRSITGNGVRQTLRIIQDRIPLEVHEVRSGTNVFDWKVPREWNIRDAYVKNSRGEKIIDFKKNNLHVLNYSVPVKKNISLDELKRHLFTIPEHPDWIPYRTSYYKENWGFCLRHDRFMSLAEDEYEVFIDSSLEDGYLTYGEFFIQGETADEILISCHVCHPSLCNDNLSGIAVSVFLARHLMNLPQKYSYRFLFIPGTIGSITWLSLNELHVSRIKHGLVVACLGDAGGFTYKKSRRGDADIDSAVTHVLKHCGTHYEILDFTPYGYDERQYCSPGFDLPIGCLMRTPYGKYPEYHTSADNLEFIRPESLNGSLSLSIDVLNVLENNRKYISTNQKCEPQLGKRGLYEAIGGQKYAKVKELSMLWILNMSDGNNSLLDIAERSELHFDVLKETADILSDHNLIEGI